MRQLSDFKIAVYADIAARDEIRRLKDVKLVRGFTTNPSLMRQAGVTDYEGYSRELVRDLGQMPISLEVFADDLPEMRRQALQIATWGSNVYVKIPVTNTLGESTAPLIKELSRQGVRLNITALLTLDQTKMMADAVEGNADAILSLFAGRIADTGRDPMPVMRAAKEYVKGRPNLKTLWASSRELLNLVQAEESGTDIITLAPAIIGKFGGVGTDLNQVSLDTVKAFRKDALSAGFSL